MEFYLSEVKQEEKEILYRLLQYSLFEESENDLNEMNQEAIYEYKYFDSYLDKSYLLISSKVSTFIEATPSSKHTLYNESVLLLKVSPTTIIKSYL